ncbi:MAG TPA: FAD-dependent monooxygenase [Polyangiaceae bacterium]|nr:FAD-dependent monooxygenase [Polyangiaceae bacterium]
METHRDIVIVGGGPAGSTTALAIAQAAPELASRVVLLEKARYPRDKPCAGALGGRGDALLRSLGVDVDVPSVSIDGVSFRTSTGEGVAAPGRIGRVVRRIEFDHALARAVASRGVAVREGVRVSGVRDDHRGGALVETSEGERRARVVIGCDGVGSVVRKALGLGGGGLRAQVIEVDTEPLPGDRDRSLLHFDASDRRLQGYAWDFPTIVGGRALVSRGVYGLATAANAGERPDVGVLLADRLRALGVDLTRCENKRYAERGYEHASRMARGAIMLVGEAAGIDIATGEGIAQAIEYGVLAGRFVARRIEETRGGPLAVDGWAALIAASRLARDLRIRSLLMRLFCGKGRAQTERLLTDSPDMLHVGCQHFAAQPYDWLKLGKVAARGAARLLPFLLAATWPDSNIRRSS